MDGSKLLRLCFTTTANGPDRVGCQAGCTQVRGVLGVQKAERYQCTKVRSNGVATTYRDMEYIQRYINKGMEYIIHTYGVHTAYGVHI